MHSRRPVFATPLSPGAGPCAAPAPADASPARVPDADAPDVDLAASEALFHAALELPRGERDAYLRSRYPDQPDLVASVLALIAADEAVAGGDAPLWQSGGNLADLLTAVDDTTGDDADPGRADGDDATPPDAVPRLAPGDRVGAYRVLRLIGRGGMGAVHLAERVDVGGRIALKLVRPAYANDDRATARLLAERRALARVDHPNVARLLDAGIVEGGPADGVPWFAMEYVAGDPIDQACDRRRLGLRERLAVFAAVCDAVEAVHRHLVVHRDLKPSNVLVTADGRPVLLDFGIAALLDPSPARDPGDDAPPNVPPNATPRAPDAFLTPQYAAPEQLRGDPSSVSVDVYALGLLLFELLTGRRPYHARGATRADAVRAVLEAAVPRPSDVATLGDDAWQRAAARATRPAPLARAFRGDLDAIVRRATAREPADRYATVGALAADVRRVLAYRPVAARNAAGVRGLAYRTRRIVRRHRALAATLAVLAVAGAATTASVARAARVASAERDRAREGAERAGRVRTALVALFDAANPDYAGQAPARSPESLLRHGEAMADALADQPETQADLLVAIGQAWNGVGDPHAAARAFARAVRLRQTHLPADDPHVAEARRQLASTVAMAARLDSIAGARPGRAPGAHR